MVCTVRGVRCGTLRVRVMLCGALYPSVAWACGAVCVCACVALIECGCGVLCFVCERGRAGVCSMRCSALVCDVSVACEWYFVLRAVCGALRVQVTCGALWMCECGVRVRVCCVRYVVLCVCIRMVVVLGGGGGVEYCVLGYGRLPVYVERM